VDDYSPLEDAQTSSSRFSKNWDDNERLSWRMDVVEHCRTGILPFGVLVLRGSFDGRLTLAIEGE
jgi:hypothetical protein